MKAIVVYESLWGNTAAIARAIAEGIGPEARALSTAEATGPAIADVDLLVAGSPFHRDVHHHDGGHCCVDDEESTTDAIEGQVDGIFDDCHGGVGGCGGHGRPALGHGVERVDAAGAERRRLPRPHEDAPATV